VKTVDNGFLILRPNTIAKIVAYSIDAQDPTKTHVKFELTQGVAREISGQGVKQARQNFRFNTPVAAIGVRGTDFTVYTDQHTTRVAVLSGGVVMSGFDANCSAAGTGPCEGRDARELFAGQAGLLLQVERGRAVPQLLQAPALSPDQNEKPRADEPVAKAAAASTPMAQVDLDPQRTDESLKNAKPVTGPIEVDPVVVVAPPVVVLQPPQPETPVVPPKPSVPEIFWGRWQSVAGVPAKLGRIGSPDVEIATYYGNYAISRLKNSALVMPNEGNAAFKLTGGEAVITSNNGIDRIAHIDSAQLNMNFSNKTFATALLVSAGIDHVNVNGSGVLTSSGMLYEDNLSNTVIRGYLGGANAEQAGYIFKNSATPGIVVSGATTWTR
jgi:hypothetical protein